MSLFVLFFLTAVWASIAFWAFSVALTGSGPVELLKVAVTLAASVAVTPPFWLVRIRKMRPNGTFWVVSIAALACGTVLTNLWLGVTEPRVEGAPAVVAADSPLDAPIVETSEPLVSDPPYLPAGPERLPGVPPNVAELIGKARAELEKTELPVSGCRGKGKGILACRGDYLLSVTDATGKITLVTVYEGAPPSVRGYAVAIGTEGKRATGVNPDVRVTHPPGITVLALKTAINWAGKGTWVVYVPYSEEINTTEVRQAGIDYLWGEVREVNERLRAEGTKSQFLRGLVADVVPADHVFTLVLTENVSHPELFTSGGNNRDRLRLLNEALTQLGANQSAAWDYRHSSAGARGKGQFMPKTYASLCRAYRIACTEFAHGSRDDDLVFALMFLHADDEWRGIKNRKWLWEHPVLMRQYLAAGYNGFYGTAARAIRACGESGWREETCRKPLRSETRPYVDKYAWISGLLFDWKYNRYVARAVYPDAAKPSAMPIAPASEKPAVAPPPDSPNAPVRTNVSSRICAQSVTE